VTLGLIVPVLNRFDLFTAMIASIDVPVLPIVIKNWEANYGVASGWNMGLRRARELGVARAIIANDDVEFSPGAIGEMNAVMDETGAFLVSANQNGSKSGQRYIDGADFFCYLVDVNNLIETVGWFDENIWPAYFEDNDMHRRMVLAGRDGKIAIDAHVKHHGSATQNYDPECPVVIPEKFVGLRDYFIEKWGGEPGKETFVNPYNDPSMGIKDFHGQ
jgi:GT2 family glycosyltransferase